MLRRTSVSYTVTHTRYSVCVCISYFGIRVVCEFRCTYILYTVSYCTDHCRYKVTVCLCLQVPAPTPRCDRRAKFHTAHRCRAVQVARREKFIQFTVHTDTVRHAPDPRTHAAGSAQCTNALRSPHLYPKHPTPHKPHNPILSITYRAMHSKSGLPPRTKGRDATALDANAPRRVVLAVCHWQRLTAARMR